MLDAAAGVPARLVLDLTAVDRATFMRTLALDNKARTDTAKSAAREPPPAASTDPRPHDRHRSRAWRTRYRRQGARRRA